MSITDIKEMSILERIHVMELLWDSLCDDEQQVESPEWHETVLNSRKQKIDSGSAEFLTLEEVRQRYQK